MTTRPTHSQIKSALLRARTLIADPTHWTRHTERRRTHAGTPDTPEAYSYCALGALKQATNQWDNDPILERDPFVLDAAIKSLRETMGTQITYFNDRFASDHKAVVDKFDAAIAKEARLAEREARR